MSAIERESEKEKERRSLGYLFGASPRRHIADERRLGAYSAELSERAART